jgi:hypothetical protein
MGRRILEVLVDTVIELRVAVQRVQLDSYRSQHDDFQNLCGS